MRSRKGVAAVEFALTFPILLLLFAPAFQLSRAALLQLRIETLALSAARRAAAAPEGADLAAEAGAAVSGVRPPVACVVGVRRVWDGPAAAPRRPRRLDVIEVDLSAAGPRLWPGAPPLRLRGHAREARWSAP